jgi:hypothetical protein
MFGGGKYTILPAKEKDSGSKSDDCVYVKLAELELPSHQSIIIVVIGVMDHRLDIWVYTVEKRKKVRVDPWYT